MALRNIRQRSGYTQQALAEELGYGQEYISRIETGARRPSLEFLRRFAELVRFPLADLLTIAGILIEPPIDEDHIVQMIAVRPQLAAAFEYARSTGNTQVLADLERFAGMLLKEAGIDYESRDGPPPGA